jgi:hypothetical protein
VCLGFLPSRVSRGAAIFAALLPTASDTNVYRKRSPTMYEHLRRNVKINHKLIMKVRSRLNSMIYGPTISEPCQHGKYVGPNHVSPLEELNQSFAASVCLTQDSIHFKLKDALSSINNADELAHAVDGKRIIASLQKTWSMESGKNRKDYSRTPLWSPVLTC